MQVTINRKEIRFSPDPSRIIARFFYTNDARGRQVILHVMNMEDSEVEATLNQILRNYSVRHRNISLLFKNHFYRVNPLLEQLKIDPLTIGPARQALIGSYFTNEYSIEAAAFFNPSVVEDPDQSGLTPEEKRLIFSFRATGEGHISSIVFRSGILDKNCNLRVEPVGKMLAEANIIQKYVYDKEIFVRKLDEMSVFNNKLSVLFVLEQLDDKFTYGELKRTIDNTKISRHMSKKKQLILDEMLWLAESHYDLHFTLDSAISERVIFPASQIEKNGIEDARFVKFTDTDGEVTYYATYTAYDGKTILPKLLETKNFYDFKSMAIHGEIAQNKGMALFPRKINGQYAMLCRLDGVNNYIAYSDNVAMWHTAKQLQSPKYPWEFIQIGNCGSPIETSEGWLVITHGVGPMREYVLGASLYDLYCPEKEIGRLKTPLLSPNSAEREGYVPNVVYSCGSMVHQGQLVIPYGISDCAATYASIDLNELIRAIRHCQKPYF